MMFDQILSHLRQQGERITPQRRVVLQILTTTHEHLALNTIQAQLKQHGEDLPEPTIYRILQWLKSCGVIAQTDLGDNIVYQLIDDPPHHHLICLKCKAITDIDDTVMHDLRQQLRQRFQFVPRIDHMAIFGICQNCQDSNT